MAVGYATLYGDMAGRLRAHQGLQQIAGVPARRMANSKSPVIPPRVIERAPSAELAA